MRCELHGSNASVALCACVCTPFSWNMCISMRKFLRGYACVCQKLIRARKCFVELWQIMRRWASRTKLLVFIDLPIAIIRFDDILRRVRSSDHQKPGSVSHTWHQEGLRKESRRMRRQQYWCPSCVLLGRRAPTVHTYKSRLRSFCSCLVKSIIPVQHFVWQISFPRSVFRLISQTALESKSSNSSSKVNSGCSDEMFRTSNLYYPCFRSLRYNRSQWPITSY